MILILIAIVAIIAIAYSKRCHTHWRRRGVIQGNPMFMLGDTWRLIFKKLSAPELTEMLYNIGPNSRYCGAYQFLQPTLVLRDPDLIKQITVKDFDHFVDRRAFVDEDGDPLFGKNLLSIKGQKWREMRSTLSPAFTSSKMKYIFTLISQSGEQFVKHFLKKDDNVITTEMRDVITKFTNDVIANTVFGFECDSLEQPDNKFYLMGKEATDFTTLKKLLVFMGYVAVPKLCKFLKLSLFSEEMNHFFRKIVRENIASREKHGIARPDMINLLMEARRNVLKHDESLDLPETGFAAVHESEIGKSRQLAKEQITDDYITAQAFSFFFAGFDSVSSLLCFMSHELGVNPNVQERLRQEVDKTREKCSNKITYEALSSMKYMDMVVSETLRKWPNAIAVDRLCTKPYTIEPKSTNETPLYLEKDDLVVIPIYAIHRDAQYYPEPDRFDPDRFSEENKHKITPYTYLPFGSGPRNCIGSRFALLETKILFFYLLSHFEIIPVEETQIPLRFNRKAMNMAAEKGFWLGLKRRNNQ